MRVSSVSYTHLDVYKRQVKMLGEEEEVEDERSFSSKSPLRRITVILAGATMNIICLLYTSISCCC